VPDPENLRTIAEVAIAIAGFSGVVVVFRPASRIWTDRDRLRFTLLVQQALVVLLFSFFPLLAREAAIDELVVGRVSNGLLGITQLGLSIFVVQAVSQEASGNAPSQLPLYSVIAISCTIGLAQLLHALGAISAAGPFLYLLSLLFILTMALRSFVLLARPSE